MCRDKTAFVGWIFYTSIKGKNYCQKKEWRKEVGSNKPLWLMIMCISVIALCFIEVDLPNHQKIWVILNNYDIASNVWIFAHKNGQNALLKIWIYLVFECTWYRCHLCKKWISWRIKWALNKRTSWSYSLFSKCRIGKRSQYSLFSDELFFNPSIW